MPWIDGVEFEWDPRKAEGNLAKHGLSFVEAATAFGDPMAMTFDDPIHSDDEDRRILFGHTDQTTPGGRFIRLAGRPNAHHHREKGNAERANDL